MEQDELIQKIVQDLIKFYLMQQSAHVEPILIDLLQMACGHSTSTCEAVIKTICEMVQDTKVDTQAMVKFRNVCLKAHLPDRVKQTSKDEVEKMCFLYLKAMLTALL